MIRLEFKMRITKKSCSTFAAMMNPNLLGTLIFISFEHKNCRMTLSYQGIQELVGMSSADNKRSCLWLLEKDVKINAYFRNVILADNGDFLKENIGDKPGKL